jgi:hypothetical protein
MVIGKQGPCSGLARSHPVLVLRSRLALSFPTRSPHYPHYCREAPALHADTSIKRKELLDTKSPLHFGGGLLLGPPGHPGLLRSDSKTCRLCFLAAAAGDLPIAS